MSFTVFSYNATVLLIQPNPTQPMDGPNPCPSLMYYEQVVRRRARLGACPRDGLWSAAA